jgi:hypothetical protein
MRLRRDRCDFMNKFQWCSGFDGDQFKFACVGRADMTDKDVDLEQPCLSPALRARSETSEAQGSHREVTHRGELVNFCASAKYFA